MPDARRFSNLAEFRRLVIEDIDQVNRAFVEKLATFALRRTMTFDDRTALEQIEAEHKFLQDLNSDEIPAVAPKPFTDGSTIQQPVQMLAISQSTNSVEFCS